MDRTALAKNIGSRIRTRRKEKGLTMKELGEKLQCTEQAISQYERGTRLPMPEILTRLGVALDVEIERFIPTEEEQVDYYLQRYNKNEQNRIGENIKGLASTLKTALEQEEPDKYLMMREIETICKGMDRLTLLRFCFIGDQFVTLSQQDQVTIKTFVDFVASHPTEAKNSPSCDEPAPSPSDD